MIKIFIIILFYSKSFISIRKTYESVKIFVKQLLIILIMKKYALNFFFFFFKYLSYIMTCLCIVSLRKKLLNNQGPKTNIHNPISHNNETSGLSRLSANTDLESPVRQVSAVFVCFKSPPALPPSTNTFRAQPQVDIFYPRFHLHLLTECNSN